MTESVEGGLILQQKWEDLSVYLFSCVLRDMPKNDRFTLGADIRATVWEVEAALVQLSLRAGNRWTLLNTVEREGKGSAGHGSIGNPRRRDPGKTV